MKAFILNRPWLFIIAGYMLGVSALTTMIVIAVRHQDPAIVIKTASKHPLK